MLWGQRQAQDPATRPSRDTAAHGGHAGCGIPLSEPNRALAGPSVLAGVNTAERPKASGGSAKHCGVCPVTSKSVRVPGGGGTLGLCFQLHTVAFPSTDM